MSCCISRQNGIAPGSGGGGASELVELWRGDFRTLTPGVLAAGPLVLNGRTFTVETPTVGETIEIDAVNGLEFNWPNATVGSVFVSPRTAGNVFITLEDLIGADYDPSAMYLIEAIATQFTPAAGNNQRLDMILYTPANVPNAGATLRARGAAFNRYSDTTVGATQDVGTLPGTTTSLTFGSVADTLGLVVQPAPVATLWSLSSGGDFADERNTIGRFSTDSIAAAGNFNTDNAREAQLLLGTTNPGAGNGAYLGAFSLIRVLAY